MRGIFDHAVAFLHGFMYQTELSVFQVANATVCHVRGSCRCAGAKVSAIDQQYVHAVERQVTECAHAINPPADDEDSGGLSFERL